MKYCGGRDPVLNARRPGRLHVRSWKSRVATSDVLLRSGLFPTSVTCLESAVA